jgi:O-antigen ligase
VAFLAPGGRAARKCLRIFAWFAFLVAVISVLAYYTSPAKVLWIFPNAYPDSWGPFLNRDNFAQFLELALPVALWLAFTRDLVYAWMAAAMLAAGIASASRAGAALLLIESLTMLLCARPPRRILARFLLAATALMAIAGASQLASRLRDPDPLRYRREMAESTLAMIRERPWTGFGLGAFPVVYPRFARFDAGLAVDHAHDDWLEWTSEGGVGFEAAWVVLAIVTLRRARNRLWTIGILAVMVHALVDYPFARSGISGWIFFLIGMREVGASAH